MISMDKAGLRQHIRIEGDWIGCLPPLARDGDAADLPRKPDLHITWLCFGAEAAGERVIGEPAESCGGGDDDRGD